VSTTCTRGEGGEGGGTDHGRHGEGTEDVEFLVDEQICAKRKCGGGRGEGKDERGRGMQEKGDVESFADNANEAGPPASTQIEQGDTLDSPVVIICHRGKAACPASKPNALSLAKSDSPWGKESASK
jgi:hypothetical protein